MKFKLNLVNSSISFINKDLSIKENNINIIIGENGIGKSTILKNLIFSKNEYDKKYKQEHFSYVEEDPPMVEVKLKKYLTRYNKNINKDDLNDLLNYFDLDRLPLNKKVKTLSGGELTLLNIISALLKNSEYIFLDEPSSNLDNESVIKLIKKLEEYSKSHTVIIITHDTRLIKTNYNQIIITKGDIKCDEEIEDFKIDSKKTNKNKYPYFKILKSFITEPLYLLSSINCLVWIFVLFSANLVVFNEYYSDYSLPEKSNSIITYIVDGEYTDLNVSYAEAAHIDSKIKEDTYSNLITFSNIPEINSLDHVTSVYYSDSVYLESFYKAYDKVDLPDKPLIVAVPNKILKNYETILFRKNYLILGRLPNDNAGEIVLSNDMIAKYFPSLNSDNALGSSVLINGSYFKIVGIGGINVCYMSFDEDYSYGFNKYNELTFDQSSKEQISYNLEINYRNPYNPKNLFINIEDGYEKEVLNELVIDYPANNYDSYKFSYYIQLENNKKMLRFTYLVNVIISVILSIIVFFLIKKQFNLYESYTKFYDNYYIEEGKTKHILLFSRLLQSAFLIVFSILFTRLMTNYEFMTSVILLDTVILIIPFYLYYLLKRKIHV